MRKKLTVTIITIITIIYIIITAFFFIIIQTIEAPEVLLKVEITELNSNEAILHTTVDIDNPNGFEIVAKNLELVTTTQDGYEVADISIKGGEISPNKNRTFTNEIFIAFNGHSPELLTTKISGEIGANFLFIQKTINLNIGVITSIGTIINEIVTPSASITVEFGELIQGSITLTAIIDINNPNSFNISIEDISADFKTETGKIVGSLDITGGTIQAKNSLSLNCNGTILFEALNAEMLTLNLSADIEIQIAGFEKKLPFNINTNLLVPDFEELLLSKDIPIFLSIKLDEKFTLRGIFFYVTLEINNSYKFDLEIKNLTFSIFTVADDDNLLLGQNNKIEKISAKAGTEDQSSCQILVPYSKILQIDWSTDWIMASVTGRISIKGISQSAFLEIRGYQSLHPIR